MSDLKSRAMDRSQPPLDQLTSIMALLRSEEGCAWDRVQTHTTLLPYLIEETYEVVDTIESGDLNALPEELGDLLCQIVFHSQLGQERKQFDLNDVARLIADKLIRRHPHVFDERMELTPSQVRDQWERIKTSSGEKETVLGGIPKSMPALTMAFRIGEKAGGVGFDWKRSEDVIDKIYEELDEVRAELGDAPSERSEEQKAKLSGEIGDLLFAVASLARKNNIDPETALKQALFKFRTRFNQLETQITSERDSFDEFSLEELEERWQNIKRKEVGESDLQDGRE